MIDVIIKMTVSAEKRTEVFITIKDLLRQIRREQDCISCHCYLDIETEEIIVFAQEWKTNEAFDAHLRSGRFKVLLGVMKLLTIEPEISINTVVVKGGLEAIAAQRLEIPTRNAT